ncbi:MAG: carnitine dehydratase, partial [Deltaproteobacteria bacterium]|nr:carnitine dehydratase [Deltaproteobacteria bacterium]
LLETLVNGRVPARSGNRSPASAPHGCYRCRGDERFCAIAVASEDEWARFCTVIGHPEWRCDTRFADQARRLANVEALDALVETWTCGREAEEVMAALQGAGVAAGVVQHVADLARDPQLAARGFFERLPHATRGWVVATGIPLGLTDPPARSGGAGQAIGQDHDYVFGELLGMTADEIAAATENGAIERSG